MRFAIFSHVEHFIQKNGYFAYNPYVKEMNIWCKYATKVVVVAPTKKRKVATDMIYSHHDLDFIELAKLNFTSVKNALISATKLPLNFFKIYKEMYNADHLHIRCPGNIGLMAAIIQVLFPSKPKTIKYAGNWDLLSKQPISYRFQKWLLNNELLTQNAKVLVYGKWEGSGKNIIPFFTATYSKNIKENFEKKFHSPYKFIFVGSLSSGKRPIFAVKIIENLLKRSYKVSLDIYGDGALYQDMEIMIKQKSLTGNINLHGAQNSEKISEAYKNSHFSILPSKSEGWPKALAEAMFFGCIPIATEVSCVPWMLGYGKRGVLIEPDIETATNKIEEFLRLGESIDLMRMSINSRNWSQKYTLERFESRIKKMI